MFVRSFLLKQYPVTSTKEQNMLKLLNISAKYSQTDFTIRLALALLIPALFMGCFANYGKYRQSWDVAKMFESLQVPGEYRYYYAGSDKDPDALLGLHRDYNLNNALWKETEMDSKKLKNWIDEINLVRYLRPASGYYILDPDNNIIGIYYSKWAGGPVKMESGNEVVVHLPNTRLEDTDSPKSHRLMNLE
jgi:hypothetical protein